MDLSEHGASLIWSKTYFFQSALDVPNSPNLIWSIMCLYTCTNYTDLTYYADYAHCTNYTCILYILFVDIDGHIPIFLPNCRGLKRCTGALRAKYAGFHQRGLTRRGFQPKKILGILKQQSSKAGTCEKLVIIRIPRNLV